LSGRPKWWVELADDLARYLQVRDLVLSHRHRVRAVQRHVRRLQDRVPEEAVGVEVLLLELLLLLLEGRHPLQPADGRDHGEEQVELGVLLDVALDEERAALGIESGGDPVGEHLPLGLRDARGVLVLAGEGVPVGRKEKTFGHLADLDQFFTAP